MKVLTSSKLIEIVAEDTVYIYYRMYSPAEITDFTALVHPISKAALNATASARTVELAKPPRHRRASQARRTLRGQATSHAAKQSVAVAEGSAAEMPGQFSGDVVEPSADEHPEIAAEVPEGQLDSTAEVPAEQLENAAARTSELTGAENLESTSAVIS